MFDFGCNKAIIFYNSSSEISYVVEFESFTGAVRGRPMKTGLCFNLDKRSIIIILHI